VYVIAESWRLENNTLMVHPAAVRAADRELLGVVDEKLGGPRISA